MTTAVVLLERLRHAGVRVFSNGDRLILDGPTEALPDRVVALVRRHKLELLCLLAAPQGVSTHPECGWCGAVLAPYLIRLAGGVDTLLCSNCRRWTAVGTPS